MSDNRTQKTPPSGASLQEIGLSKRLSAWLAHHQLVAVETLLKLLANPLGSLLTWLVIAISLTLPGALWMALDNMEQLSGRFQDSDRITLNLTLQPPAPDGHALRGRFAGLKSLATT